MTYKTHMQGGVISVVFANLINPIQFNYETIITGFYSSVDILIYIMIGWIASILPDLDSNSSIAANGMYGIDDILRNMKILKHRGLSHFNINFSIKFLLKKLNRQSMLKKFLNIVNTIVESNFTTVLVRYFIAILLVGFSLIQHHVFLKSLIIGYCSHIVLDYIMQYIGVKTGKDIENKVIYHLLGWGSILSLLFLITQYTI